MILRKTLEFSVGDHPFAQPVPDLGFGGETRPAGLASIHLHFKGARGTGKVEQLHLHALLATQVFDPDSVVGLIEIRFRVHAYTIRRYEIKHKDKFTPEFIEELICLSFETPI